MTELKIKDYIDRYLDYAKAGNAFYIDARQCVDDGTTVVFNMTDTDAVPTVFLNSSLGQLIDEFGIDHVKASLKFKNMLRSQAERIRKYFSDYQSITSNHP